MVLVCDLLTLTLKIRSNVPKSNNLIRPFQYVYLRTGTLFHQICMSCLSSILYTKFVTDPEMTDDLFDFKDLHILYDNPKPR